MKNYVFVYFDQSPAGAPMEDTTKAWMSWFEQLGDKVVDAGNPFNAGGKAVEQSGVTTIQNLPATGYSIVKAASLDDAVELAQSCPLVASPTAAIQVYETLPM